MNGHIYIYLSFFMENCYPQLSLYPFLSGPLLDCLLSQCVRLPYFFSYKTEGFFPSQNNMKNLDPSDKTDLDLWDCLFRKDKTQITAKFYGTDLVCSHSIAGKTPGYS